MYDLFALGQLMDEPMSGYLMRQILQQLVGNQRQISFGMIYPLFKRLSDSGYITLEELNEHNHRTKKIATITTKGRHRFVELMKKSVPVNPNLEFTYTVKFRNFHQIETDLQIEILNEYQHYLMTNLQLLEQQALDLPKTNITQADLENARWVISLEQVKTKASLAWVKQALKKY